MRVVIGTLETFEPFFVRPFVRETRRTKYKSACCRQEPDQVEDRIMIYGPKSDGTYIIEFRMADGETLAISVPAGETRVLKQFQARMPYGLVVPDVP
jgi:hypothetical protein